MELVECTDSFGYMLIATSQKEHDALAKLDGKVLETRLSDSGYVIFLRQKEDVQ